MLAEEADDVLAGVDGLSSSPESSREVVAGSNVRLLRGTGSERFERSACIDESKPMSECCASRLVYWSTNRPLSRFRVEDVADRRVCTVSWVEFVAALNQRLQFGLKGGQSLLSLMDFVQFEI